MSYDFSFDKKGAALLAACAAAAAVLLVLAGFLLGTQHASAPLPTAAVLPDIAKGADDSQPSSRAASSTTSGIEHPGPPLSSTSGASDPGAVAASDTSAPTTPAYALQLGAFAERANADAEVKDLKDKSVQSKILTLSDSAGRTWFVVRSGSYASLSDASHAAAALRRSLNEPVVIRPAETL
jgi:septal ring-binding cell division protein DamX